MSSFGVECRVDHTPASASPGRTSKSFVVPTADLGKPLMRSVPLQAAISVALCIEDCPDFAPERFIGEWLGN